MTVPAGPRPDRLVRAGNVLAIAGSLACSLGTLAAGFGGGWGMLTAALGFVVFVALEQPRLNRTARFYCLAALGTLLISVVRSGAVGPALIRALASGALFAAVFASVGLLAAAARHSALVERCGKALIRQPPSRRYAALSVGGHLLSTLLSFGALPLLAAMIVHANSLEAAGGDQRVQRVRTQRMLMALLRSFCAILLWSPLSVAVLMVLAAIPGVSWSDLALFGGLEAMLLLVLGAIVDHFSFARRPQPSADHSRIPWRDALLLAGIAVVVFGVATLIHEWNGTSLTTGIIAGVPLVAIVWMLTQVPPAASLGHVGTILGDYLRGGLTAQRTEVAVVGASAVIGAVVLDLLPAHAIDGLAASVTLPPWLVVGAIVGLIVALGQIGLNPVLTVALLGPGLALGFPAIQPAVLAMALVSGWAISLQSSPFTAGVLMLAQFAQVPPSTFGRQWNGRFVLAALLFVALYLGGLQAIISHGILS